MTTFKSIVDDLGFRSHGEIFEEYYEEALGNEIKLKDVVDEIIEIAEDYFEEIGNASPDWVKAILVMKEQGNNDSQIILTYFKDHPNHGELAGTAIGACRNEGNRKLAEEIFNLIDKEGFDS